MWHTGSLNKVLLAKLIKQEYFDFYLFLIGIGFKGKQWCIGHAILRVQFEDDFCFQTCIRVQLQYRTKLCKRTTLQDKYSGPKTCQQLDHFHYLHPHRLYFPYNSPISFSFLLDPMLQSPSSEQVILWVCSNRCDSGGPGHQAGVAGVNQQIVLFVLNRVDHRILVDHGLKMLHQLL